MKKITALLLALSIVFLCACSDNKEKEQSETTTQMQESTTKGIKYITEWESELLPADFPPPPAKAYGEYASVIPAENEYSGICRDITKLIFSCPENEFYNFANSLIGHGFFGGFKKITNGTFYDDGFRGGWVNEKYTVVISESSYEDNGDLKICLNIVEKFSAFPEGLKEYFPAFDFPARQMGIYAGANSEVDETNDYHGKPEHIKWQWHIRFRDSFIGVSLDDFYKYCDKLTAAGFNGGFSSDIIDGCSVISCDMIKGESLGAFMLYNQSTKTLEVIYTNDPKSITG